MTVVRLINLLLHPFLMPLYMVFILFHSGSWMTAMNAEAKGYIYLVTFTTTLILPAISLLIFKRLGWISDYRLSDRKERRIPLMIWSVFSLLGAFIFLKATAPLFIALLFNSLSITLLVMAMISYVWKISIYLTLTGALTGMVLSITFKWMLDTRIWLAVAFVMAALAGFSRLKSEAHQPAEVYAGFALGLAGFFGITFFL